MYVYIYILYTYVCIFNKSSICVSLVLLRLMAPVSRDSLQQLDLLETTSVVSTTRRGNGTLISM